MSEIYTRGIMIGYYAERQISPGVVIDEIREKAFSLSQLFTGITAAMPSPFDKGTTAIEIFFEGSDDRVRINQPWTFEEWQTHRKMKQRSTKAVYGWQVTDDTQRYNSYLRSFYRKASLAVKFFVKGHNPKPRGAS